jgi:hypothetical protein
MSGFVSIRTRKNGKKEREEVMENEKIGNQGEIGPVIPAIPDAAVSA